MKRKKPDPALQKMKDAESRLLLLLEKDWRRFVRVVNRMTSNRKALIRLRKRMTTAENTPRSPGSNGKDG
jgi:hypothetical protein